MNRYDSYKDSGVEWLGVIPSHWRKSKFKFVSELYTGNSLNDSQKLLYESENLDDIPYVSSKDIDVEFQTINYNNGLRIPKINNPLKVSPKGSFLMVIEGGSSGRKKVYLEQDVCFVNKLCSFNSRENNKFQYYFIQSSNYQDKFKLSMSGLIGGVSISNLKDFEITLPPLSEQQQIVTFLDDKTQKIDSLIQQKKEKIELLKEKRTSLINHVVTKGLHTNVEMKDSGVEWIGEIPNIWKTVQIKRLCSVKRGSSPRPIDDPKYFDDKGEFRWVRISDVSKSERYLEKTKETLSELGSTLSTKILPNDIFLSIAGSVGKPIITKIKCCIHDGFVWFDGLHYDKELLYYIFSIGKCFSGLGKMGTQLNLNTETVGMISIPLTSQSEQQKIVEYLDKQTEEIDTLIQLEQKKIDTLKEYRQSLISEVVTGKIKVV